LILVVRFQHSHPISAGSLANVGIQKPLANIGFPAEFGFDIRFLEFAVGAVANVKSTPLVWLGFRNPHDELAAVMKTSAYPHRGNARRTHAV
jgi:hypothetical protein